MTWPSILRCPRYRKGVGWSGMQEDAQVRTQPRSPQLTCGRPGTGTHRSMSGILVGVTGQPAQPLTSVVHDQCKRLCVRKGE